MGQALGRGWIEKSLEEVMPEFNKLMDHAVKADPNDFELHRLLCGISTMTGKFKAAIEHGKKAYDMVPNDPRILQQYPKRARQRYVLYMTVVNLSDIL